MAYHILLAGYGNVGRNKFTGALIELARASELTDLTSGEGVEFTIITIKDDDIEQIENLRARLNVPGLVISEPIKFPGSFECLESLLEGRTFDYAFVAAPNTTHAPYIATLLNCTRFIYIEKPLVDNIDALKEVEASYTDADLDKVRLMDHYLMKEVFVHFFENLKLYMHEIGKIEKIHFMLIEPNAIIESRKWLYHTGMIRDLAIHALSMLCKLYEYDVIPPPAKDLELSSCDKWVYKPVPDDIHDPRETAAQLIYRLNEIDVKIQVGKGTGETKKQLRLTGPKGTLIIDTTEKTISILRDGERAILYEAPKTEFKYPEYLQFIREFFRDPVRTGLSYRDAKAQIQILEATDKFPITREHDLGKLPFDLLE